MGFGYFISVFQKQTFEGVQRNTDKEWLYFKGTYLMQGSQIDRETMVANKFVSPLGIIPVTHWRLCDFHSHDWELCMVDNIDPQEDNNG